MEKLGILSFLVITLLSQGQESLVDAQFDFSCPESDGIYANPGDCLTYIECQGQQASLRQCSSPLHFNPNRNDCDWPLFESCVKGEYDSGNYASIPKVEELEVPSEVKCPDSICACLIPHPYNCSCYYRCKNGRPIIQCCASDLYFNPAIKVCDHPKNVDCTSQTTTRRPPPTTTTRRPPPPPTTTTRRPPPPPTTTTRRPPPTTTTPRAPPTCPVVTCPPPPVCPCVDDRTPIKGDCECYIECLNGKETKKCCPNGLHFNPNTKVCDEPTTCSNVTCPCDCCFVEDPCDCQFYWRCLKGTITKLKCSGTLVFDPKRSTCDWPWNVNRVCPPVPTFPTSAPTTTTPMYPDKICWKGNGHYPHPDCRKFYHCSNNIAYVKDCPEPLHWSIARDRCEWPCIAQCDKSVGPCPPGVVF